MVAIVVVVMVVVLMVVVWVEPFMASSAVRPLFWQRFMTLNLYRDFDRVIFSHLRYT